MDDQKRSGVSRRSFVAKVATGAAGAAVALSVTAGRSGAATQHHSDVEGAVGGPLGEPMNIEPSTPVADGPVAAVAASAPAPWELLAPLREGSAVTPQWRVKSLSEIVDGASVLTLENSAGRSHRVHLCRNDGRPQGLVYTDRLDMVVMNGGRGDLPTEEGFGQAVAEVAHVLASNETRRGHTELVVSLLPQSERAERFADTSRLR